LRPEWDVNNSTRRNTITIGDITGYVNERLALRRYRASQKQSIPSNPSPAMIATI
jgi:hypothetical protein